MHFLKDLKMTLLGATVVVLATSSSFAESLREDLHDIFPSPAGEGLSGDGVEQFFVGMTEISIAGQVWPGMVKESQAIRDAQKQLAQIQAIPTTQAQKDTMIQEILVDARNYDYGYNGGRGRGSEEGLKNEIKIKLVRIRAMEILDASEKLKRVANAQESLAKVTEYALLVAKKNGFISQSVRIARAGTSILLISDVLARIYVWNVLDANPTWSPIAHLTDQELKNMLKN